MFAVWLTSMVAMAAIVMVAVKLPQLPQAVLLSTATVVGMLASSVVATNGMYFAALAGVVITVATVLAPLKRYLESSLSEAELSLPDSYIS